MRAVVFCQCHAAVHAYVVQARSLLPPLLCICLCHPVGPVCVTEAAGQQCVVCVQALLAQESKAASCSVSTATKPKCKVVHD